MNSIIFIGTNKSGSSYEGIKAAKRLGYETILLTNRTLFIEKKDDFQEIDDVRLTNMSSIDEICEVITNLILEGKEISCFISFLDEYVYLAALLTSTLCNASLTFEPLKIMTDKIETRRYLSNKSYTPFFRVLDSLEKLHDVANEIINLFPLIIKSPQSNGSKDVIYVDNTRDFKKAVKRIHRKNPNLPILIEEYLEGEQYLIEVVVYLSNINVAAIVEQEVTRGERFIITGYSLWPEQSIDQLQGLEETIKMIVEDFQINNGTFHLELKLTDNGWKLIEINPRMAGGAMNRMIEEAYGYNLAEQTIQLFLGVEPNFIKKQRKCIHTQYLIVNLTGELLRVSGCDAAMNQPGVLEVYTKGINGQIVTPPRSMGQRYGYVIATADTKERAKECAIHAAEQIQFYLQPI